MNHNFDQVMQQLGNFQSESVQNFYRNHQILAYHIFQWVSTALKEQNFQPEIAKSLIREVYECSFLDSVEEHDTEWGKILDIYPDFLTAPASTKFHGSFKHGLLVHSLLVVAYGIKLETIYGCIKDLRAFLWHDLCKCGMYQTEKKSVKVNGKWTEQMSWTVKPEYRSIQHGSESLLRLLKLGVSFTEEWERAIAYHMGLFSCHESDMVNLFKAEEKCPEVLMLQQADTIASRWAVI